MWHAARVLWGALCVVPTHKHCSLAPEGSASRSAVYAVHFGEVVEHLLWGCGPWKTGPLLATVARGRERARLRAGRLEHSCWPCCGRMLAFFADRACRPLWRTKRRPSSSSEAPPSDRWTVPLGLRSGEWTAVRGGRAAESTMSVQVSVRVSRSTSRIEMCVGYCIVRVWLELRRVVIHPRDYYRIRQ